MSKRSIVIKDIPNGNGEKEGEKKVIRIEVSYRMGGMNYFTGQRSSRGYYVSVSPMTVGNGFQSFMAFSGVCHCIEEAKRFGEKKLKSIAGNALTNHSETIQRLTDHVITKQ